MYRSALTYQSAAARSLRATPASISHLVKRLARRLCTDFIFGYIARIAYQLEHLLIKKVTKNNIFRKKKLQEIRVFNFLRFSHVNKLQFYNYDIILIKLEIITRSITVLEVRDSTTFLASNVYVEKESGMRNEQLLLSSGKAVVSRAGENSPARVFANASERNITVRDCRFIRQRARTERRLTPINVSLSPGFTSEGNEKPRGLSSAGRVFS